MAAVSLNIRAEGLSGAAGRRLGVFGGTFDPWHNGHELVLEQVLASGLTDELLVIPAATPPHKPLPQASFAHRLAMASLALKGRKGVLVSDIEQRLPPPSFTLRTVCQVLEDQGPQVLLLILGADAFLDLHHWHGVAQLLALVELLVLARPPWQVTAIQEQRQRLLSLCPGMAQVRSLTGRELPLSSSAVRRRLAAGEDPVGLTVPEVAAYIHQHGLYSLARPTR